MTKNYLKNLYSTIGLFKNIFTLSFVIISLFSFSKVHAQYCMPATTNETIIPTAVAQNTTTYNSGARAFNFAATAGCTYTFSTCGLASTDTYLRLYSTGTGGIVLVAADDQCGLQSSFTWACGTSGTYSVLLTNYVCAALTANTTMSYILNSCAAPENTVPATGNNSYTLCSGTLYDHAGSAGNYNNGVSGYTVINPSIGGNMVQLTGNIITEASFDFVRIYDGVGTGGTLLYSGSGTASIGTITSTLGPLTVQFTSDGSVIASGFALNIACIIPIPPNPTSITASVPSFCSNVLGSSTLTANGAIGTVYWFTAGCNTAGEFATGNSVVVSPVVTTTYYARNYSGGQWSAGCASITINVNAAPTAPTAVTATPAILCSGGSSNLNATSVGNTINWYTVPSGGVSIGSSASGANFSVTPGVTTTYYAEAQSVAAPGSQTFNLTGGMQTFTVPAGVTSINIEAWGAEGGSASSNVGWDPLFQMGGDGGYSTGTLAVTPGQVLHVYVGGKGGAGNTGGYNGGGLGSAVDPTTTSSGGGASDIRILPGNLADRILVAAGGGGAEWAGGGLQAGQGGGLTGGANGGGDSPAASGNPGTPAAGGAAGSDPCGGSFGPTFAGGFGFGGNSVTGHSGGGGGGYYGGGGGGCDGHGGGGSSYLGGVTAGTTTAGVRIGDGQVIISWTGGSGCVSSRTAVTVTVASGPTASISTASSTICHGTQTTLSGPVTATGAWTVTLSDGQTATGTGNGTWSITVTPSVTTTYTITSIVDASTCLGIPSGSVTLTLPAAGTTLGLNNESATCVVNQNGWVHFYHASGRLLASVNSLGQNLGNVTVTSYVDGSPLSVPACDYPLNPDYTTAYMQRHWVITPTIQPSVPVQVRLPFGNTEFSALSGVANTNPNTNDNVLVPNDLKLTKYSGPLNVNNSASDNCPSNGGSGGSTIHNQALTGATTGYSAVTGATYTDFSIPGFSEFWLHGSLLNSPLPVEMSNMQVNCNENNEVAITWSTQSEFNSSHFLIEQSRTGQDWQVIATISAAGNSTSLLNYSSTIMDNIGGISYYRILQYDNNGEFEVYGPLSAECADAQDGLINLYPNPSEGIIYINYQASEAEEKIDLVMVDATGALVKMLNTSLVKGNNTLIMDNSEIAPGMYFIQLIGESWQSENVKLIKQ